MPQPRKTIRPIAVKLMLPEDLVAKVFARLYSELQGRIPLGDLSKFFERAARDLMTKLEQEEL